MQNVTFKSWEMCGKSGAICAVPTCEMKANLIEFKGANERAS